ncbi:hypothetical protein COOONC_11507 [Cooperia oncophora]
MYTVTVQVDILFDTIQHVQREGPDPCMACVVSIGTGSSPAENTNGIDLNFNSIISNKRSPLQIARGFITVVNNAKNMFQILVRECTSSSGQPVRYSREWCHSLDVPFFRFSPMMRTGVQLDNTDTDVLIQMLWETEVCKNSSVFQLGKLK